MGKPTGFLEYERKVGECAAPLERIKNFREFHGNLPKTEQQLQGARCMACGVPFCQAGVMIAGMVSGCPLQNLVPEWNDLVYSGNWEKAYNGKYRSLYNANALVASIDAFRARYGMQLDFCKEETTGRLIRDILYRELKEHLQGLEK